MPNYDILVNWTEQGIKNVKDSVRRSEAFETAIEKAGGKSIGLYYTLEKHDMVAIVEAPNDEVIASVLYRTGSLGNVSTETLKAFSMSEASDIIEKIS
ncbi:MAG TPA: GYD domain-containing protein [Nitrososphaeraceae archaeon]